MRWSQASVFLVATVTVAVVSATTTAFIRPTSKAGSRPTCVTAAWGKQRPLFNSVRVVVPRSTHTRLDSSVAKKTESDPATTSAPVSVAVAVQPGRLSETEINARLAAQLEKMRLKDKMSPLLTKEELKIIYEDDHVVIVDKPSGVLTVSGKDKNNHSLAQAVYATVRTELPDADRMVVHRLGMDTSGLVVFAKTVEAVKGMNTIFRTREIQRTYEAVVCGHVTKNKGLIALPLMRDYEHPPYMRISTDEHQEALIGLDPEIVGKKLLELPKESLTKYVVLSREELNGQPVTRVSLTSISGRTHQLNCHLAALGHPIVGDLVYGWGGDAAPNGGLTEDELQYLMKPNPARATPEQQLAANAAVNHISCCHAKSIRFRHPVTKKEISLCTDAPF